MHVLETRDECLRMPSWAGVGRAALHSIISSTRGAGSKQPRIHNVTVLHKRQDLPQLQFSPHHPLPGHCHQQPLTVMMIKSIHPLLARGQLQFSPPPPLPGQGHHQHPTVTMTIDFKAPMHPVMHQGGISNFVGM